VLLALASAVFSGPSPLGLKTIFYCLTFETSLFVASYDSQGHGGGIRPRLHSGGNKLELFFLIYIIVLISLLMDIYGRQGHFYGGGQPENLITDLRLKRLILYLLIVLGYSGQKNNFYTCLCFINIRCIYFFSSITIFFQKSGGADVWFIPLPVPMRICNPYALWN
jgi:hypothetical protein